MCILLSVSVILFLAFRIKRWTGLKRKYMFEVYDKDLLDSLYVYFAQCWTNQLSSSSTPPSTKRISPTRGRYKASSEPMLNEQQPKLKTITKHERQWLTWRFVRVGAESTEEIVDGGRGSVELDGHEDGLTQQRVRVQVVALRYQVLKIYNLK